MTERRTVLKVLATTGAAGVAAAAVVPAAGLVLAPSRAPPPPEAGWVTLCRLDALEPSRPRKFPVTGIESDAWTVAPERRLGAVWLQREGDQVRALSEVCPHLGCGTELSGDHFECPCHDSSFALDGRCLSGPSPRGLDPLEVRVADGRVSVRFRRFEQGVPERRPVG
ncbi:MAG: Rieske 2Fe-2S domain-containing protein [Deltaproteobacteria bacterium]|nr:Rieske 2Fe-2S domain-containing protein [Deltaproteobacteria bacterium]